MGQKTLIEVGVEELPAIPLLKIIDSIENTWSSILKSRGFDSSFKFEYTPRRLVLIHPDLPESQPDRVEELVGPPESVAVKDGTPTKAGEGFARKCGVSFDELDRVEKGGRVCLYFKREIKGEETKNLLPDMIREWIESMNFGKMMRWGDKKDEFIRPVRWLQVRMGNDSIDMELFGVKSDTKTYLHRMVSFEPVEVPTIDSFEDTLRDGKVILSAKERREMIEAQIDEIEKSSGLSVERDSELLNEVVAITEYPQALLGSFDESFLELPPEVIVTSMKEHQRYFAVYDADNRLANRFIVVSNAVTDDYSKVIAGNERVLRPRLSDALFFYHNDLKRGLVTDGLEKIQFIDGLGTLADKVNRERNIALRLTGIYMDRLEADTGKSAMEIEELMDRAVSIAKADLLSEMVYEFTELQGLMGYYYAKALGEDELVAEAIRDQYKPVGEGASLPESLFSAILAISIKLDTLMGLFSVGKIPSGSRDPFALRRAVNGIVRTVVEYDLPFDIQKIIELLKDQYKEFDTNKLEEFILDRIYKSIDANPSVIKAVLSSGERDITEIYKKVASLNKIVSSDEAKDIFTTFKRVANISNDIDINSDLSIDESLFVEDEERELYEAFKDVISKDYSDYSQKLEALFGLKAQLDKFFDNVLVNAEDEKLRANRRKLIASIYKAFRDIADIKEISI